MTNKEVDDGGDKAGGDKAGTLPDGGAVGSKPELAVPFSELLRTADALDWLLMLVGTVSAACTGAVQPWCDFSDLCTSKVAPLCARAAERRPRSPNVV